MTGGDILFTTTPNSNIASCTSEQGAGGVAYLKTTMNVLSDLNGATLINYSKSKLHGAVFALNGLITNKLVIGDDVKISNSESTDEEGGVAIFYGANNYLVMEPKSEI